jgi:hypothetical protein
LCKKNVRLKLAAASTKVFKGFFMKELAFFCVLLGVAGIPSDVGLSAERSPWHASRFDSGATTHKTHAESENLLQIPNVSELASDPKDISSPPTRSSFMASWEDVTDANGYLLDVSTNDSFNSYVEGYHALDVGKVTGQLVTGLNQGTTYYYRVRPYGGAGARNYSRVVSATTVPTVGLVIHPTFDSSITNAPNAALIQATISRAISIYETLFTDPITIEIRFRYATTLPDGTPLTGRLSQAFTVVYGAPWNTWINALRADATSGNDNIAIATLPANALFASIVAASANGRALGQNTPPAMFANGTVGVGGPYDGIITLNSASLLQFTRPTDANRFDAQRAIEQEIDNVMGLQYSTSAFFPIDLFSWSSPGTRNFEISGRRYFSINGGVTNIVDFNQNPNGSFAGWQSAACPQAHPYVQNAFPCAGQFSDISATSPEGIILDVIGYNLPQTGPPSLGNVSTRSFVQTGANVMIGGFIVQGSGPKRVIIRAIGPELTQYGIPNALANPTLELHNGTGALIATNNDWQTTIIGGIITGSQVSDIQNSGHAPTAASESAIIADLQPGNYTAILSGVNGTTGVALVEVYDLAPAASSSLGNVSTRSFVQTDSNVMIGGFIVQGSGPKRVIIRAIGPELSAPPYNIPNALANPTLELHNGAGALIASNDNWQTTIIGGIITSSQVSDIQNSGHAPTAASESAIIANLQPGNYTAILRGISNTTGVALVEVYDLN